MASRKKMEGCKRIGSKPEVPRMPRSPIRICGKHGKSERVFASAEEERPLLEVYKARA